MEKEHKLSFYDYYNLKRTIADDNSKPTEQISQFDNTNITYSDMYNLLSELISQVVSYANSGDDLSITSLDYLINILVVNELIGENQVKQLEQEINKKWKSGNTTDDNK